MFIYLLLWISLLNFSSTISLSFTVLHSGKVNSFRLQLSEASLHIRSNV